MERISWEIDFGGEVKGADLYKIVKAIAKRSPNWKFLEYQIVTENGIPGYLLGFERLSNSMGIWFVISHGENHSREIFKDRLYSSPLFVQTTMDCTGRIKIPDYQRILDTEEEEMSGQLRNFCLRIKKELNKLFPS